METFLFKNYVDAHRFEIMRYWPSKVGDASYDNLLHLSSGIIFQGNLSRLYFGWSESSDFSRTIDRDGSRCHIDKQTLKILWFTFIVGYSIIYYMFPIDSIKDNTHNDIIKELINPTRIHEHNFISIKTEKEQTSILCSTCRSLYCEKCGKLVTISDQNYMQYNIYN